MSPLWKKITLKSMLNKRVWACVSDYSPAVGPCERGYESFTVSFSGRIMLDDLTQDSQSLHESLLFLSALTQLNIVRVRAT